MLNPHLQGHVGCERHVWGKTLALVVGGNLVQRKAESSWEGAGAVYRTPRTTSLIIPWPEHAPDLRHEPGQQMAKIGHDRGGIKAASHCGGMCAGHRRSVEPVHCQSYDCCYKDLGAPLSPLVGCNIIFPVHQVGSPFNGVAPSTLLKKLFCQTLTSARRFGTQF
jgi:hypothetical protein